MQHETDLLAKDCGQDRLDLAETAKPVAHMMREPQEYDCSTEAWRAVLGRETRICTTIPKTRTRTVIRWRPSLEKKHDGTTGADVESYSEIWIRTSELDSAERRRS